MTPREQAIACYNQALKVRESDPQMAYKLLVSATENDPLMPEPWAAIADANAEMNLRPSAIANYRRYLELKPDDARAMVTMGHLLYHDGKIEEAWQATKSALKKDETLANGWMNLSLIQSIQGHIGTSLDSAKRGYKLDPNPVTQLALGFAYLHARELDLGLKHFEAKLPYKTPKYLTFPWPKWQGEDLSDKILFVVSDQGLGDTLDFLRFLPMVAKRCGHVTMQIQGELIRLASVMLGDQPNIDMVPLNSQLPVADFWIAITSIPVALGLTSDEIEYAPQLPILIDALPAPTQMKIPGRKLHVGICWGGSAGNDIDRYRSMPVENFLPLAQVPGVQLYSLQVGPKAVEVHSSGSAAVIKDLAPWIRDVMDTVYALKHIDLVISIESFLPHLANAVGVETWIPYARLGGDWRCGRKGARMIWHPRSRLFHQDASDSWTPVMASITEALRERVS